MKIYIEIFVVAFSALILSLILVPIIRMIAIRIRLVDNPNFRKVHAMPVPLIGGISIAISTFVALMLSNLFPVFVKQYLVMLISGSVILLVGVLDDKYDLKSSYRLMIQVACAYAVASSGILITSLHGMFGIHEIAVPFQYLLTIVVITGVVNAINLMDT